MRALALDVGDKRIGLAVSDALGITAQPLPTLKRQSPSQDIRAIAKLAAEKGAQVLVVGLPRNMDGTQGIQARRSRDFGEAVAKAAGIPLEFVDERLTSVQAHRMLREGNASTRGRKGIVDQLAAGLILETWMAQAARKKPIREDTQMAKEQDEILVDIVELEDEDGTVVRFRHELTVEHEGDLYAFVVPVEGIEDEDDDEESMVILKIVPGEGEEEDVYEGVEDDALLETLYQLYLEALDEEDEDLEADSGEDEE